MSSVFALDANGQQLPVPNGMICDWFTKMFEAPASPENRWYKIPDEHMPSGIVVAFVQFEQFLAYTGMWFVSELAHTPVPDDRPLITPQLRRENRAEWDRLWTLNKPDECPVCHEDPDIWDGPMNSDVPTRCTHWACLGCWAEIAARDKRCPICRDDLSVWISRHDGGR